MTSHSSSSTQSSSDDDSLYHHITDSQIEEMISLQLQQQALVLNLSPNNSAPINDYIPQVEKIVQTDLDVENFVSLIQEQQQQQQQLTPVQKQSCQNVVNQVQIPALSSHIPLNKPVLEKSSLECPVPQNNATHKNFASQLNLKKSKFQTLQTEKDIPKLTSNNCDLDPPPSLTKISLLETLKLEIASMKSAVQTLQQQQQQLSQNADSIQTQPAANTNSLQISPKYYKVQKNPPNESSYLTQTPPEVNTNSQFNQHYSYADAFVFNFPQDSKVGSNPIYSPGLMKPVNAKLSPRTHLKREIRNITAQIHSIENQFSDPHADLDALQNQFELFEDQKAEYEAQLLQLEEEEEEEN